MLEGKKLRFRNSNLAKVAQLVSDRAGTQAKLFFLPGEAKPWTVQLH